MKLQQNISPVVVAAVGLQHCWLSENEELHRIDQFEGRDLLSKVAFRNHSKFLCTTHFIKSLICFPLFVSKCSWYFHVLSLFFFCIYIHTSSLFYFIFYSMKSIPFSYSFLLFVCIFAFVFSSISISSTVTLIFFSRILILFP